jgi:hypothetical protein
MVDTGAGITVLDVGVVAALQTGRAASIHGHGAADEVVEIRQIVPIESMSIGGFEVRGLDAAAFDLSGLRAGIGDQLDGVLGFPTFAGTTLTIDWPKNEIRVSSAPIDDDCALVDVSRPGDWRPVVMIECGDELRPFAIDSGANDYLQVRADWGAPVTAGPLVTSASITIGAVTLSDSVRLGVDMDLCGVTFESPVASMTTMDEGIVGAKLLRYFAASFDQRAGLVQLERGAETPDFIRVQGPWDLGFIPAPDDGRAVIAMVREGSAAEGVLKVGDEIVSINGMAASEFRCARIRATISPPTFTVVVRRDGEQVEVVLPVARALA